MPRGGYRPGSGRRKRSQDPNVIEFRVSDKAVTSALEASKPGAYIDGDGNLCMPPEWESPLQYAMRVINDPSASPERRDRMAQVAAPFLHPRLGGVYLSRGRLEEREAERAGVGTPWASILKTAK
jgi:hypothetical protein